METTKTTTTRTLEIDGMTGDSCVQKVTGALRGLGGVTTHTVKVGLAKMAADQAGCDAACKAIEGAGYKCREASGYASKGSSHGTTQGSTDGAPAASAVESKPAVPVAAGASTTK